MSKTPITVAHGDGIGPEIMDATLRILDEAGAQLDINTIEIGEKLYDQGIMNGIADSSWDILRDTGVFLKAPIFTPMGGGFKSLNVTVRKSLGLYANVRPCRSFHPFIQTMHPEMDVVIIRENEEDLYAGIEYQQVQDVVQAIKLISRQGSERIVRYAFEYARANGRKKVTCMIKDNIMKLADGLFYKMFQEIGEEYPDLEKERYIIDIGAARIASSPNDFDVIVTQNLYGDIISDIAAEITGSVGLGISANIGKSCSMFEAMHGTAPDIAGKGIANPSGLLLGSVMMLVHIGQGEVAERVHNAWLRTIEDGIHTGDIFREGPDKRAEDAPSRVRAGTEEFTKALLERVGKEPEHLKPASYPADKGKMELPPVRPYAIKEKTLIGADVFVEWQDESGAEGLADRARQACVDGLYLKLISNRGVMVWPKGQPETMNTSLWRLRFMVEEGTKVTSLSQLTQLLSNLESSGLGFARVENLYMFGDTPGFTKAQGE
jgi:isocitrate dehydrogenase